MVRKNRFMELAIAKAREGMRRGQAPFAACIAKGGRIVSCEHNSVWKDTDITAHAEINAIRLACRRLGTIDLSGCEIYCTCEPCPMCFSAIHWAGMGRAFYGARIADAKKCGFGELEIPSKRMRQLGKSRMKITGGVLDGECRTLFSEFLRASGRKRLY